MNSELEIKKDGIAESSIKELVEVTKAMTEGDFSRELNIKLYGELGRLAHYINKTKQSLQVLNPPFKETCMEIPMASTQLSDITRSTEEATHKVLTLTEKILDKQEIVSEQLENLETLEGELAGNGKDLRGIIKRLRSVNAESQDDLVEILTTLSFQDLTGQKIKKIVALLGQIETKVLELIVAFDIPTGEGETLEEEEDKKRMLDKLKDSSKSIDLKQDLIDEILAGL